MLPLSDVIHLTITGVAQGCAYGLIALGFVLIYKATEVVNFAHGEFMMLGAFTVLAFSEATGFGFWPAFVLGCVTIAVVGYLVDATIMRRIIGESQASVFILTVAFGFIFRALAGMIFGWNTSFLEGLVAWIDGIITFAQKRLHVVERIARTENEQVLVAQSGERTTQLDMQAGIQAGRQGNLDAGNVGLGIHDEQRHEQAVIETPFEFESTVDTGLLHQALHALGQCRVSRCRIFVLIGFRRKAVIVEKQGRRRCRGDRDFALFPVCADHDDCLGTLDGRRKITQETVHAGIAG